MLSFVRRCRRPAALVLALVLCLTPLASVADTYDVGQGDVTVTASGDTQTVTGYNSDTQQNVVDYTDPDPVITGTSTGADAHTVTITAEAGATASVTLSGLNIDASANGAAAVTTSGAGDVVVELEGESSLTSGYPHAGLEKGNDGSLTIQDENHDGGSLTATGGKWGAGIGSGNSESATDITISGGTVLAIGGEGGAGIGGGLLKDGAGITITGGTVTAVGGNCGAGIGGGFGGNGETIEITGGTVIAVGGLTAAGIGGGGVVFDGTGEGSNITVSGSAQVSAAGGAEDAIGVGPGAAIGNGGEGKLVPGAEAEDTGELHTEGLYTTGSISYYPAGATAEQIRNKAVDPVKVVYGTVEPPVDEPEEDPFAAFTERLAWQIRTAPEKGVVEAGAGNWPGLQRAVFEALQKRPDVTLKITCRMKGEKTTLTIPGTADLTTALGSGWMLTFEEIAKIVG